MSVMRKGAALTELTMVAAVLILFGVTITALLSSGADAQRRSDESGNAETAARTALGYITVKARQNDRSGGIRIGKAPGGGDAVVFLDAEASAWVFSDGGRLLEYVGLADDAYADASLSFVVAESPGLTLRASESGGLIDLELTVEVGGETREFRQSLALRSDGG
ncbi:MAG: DUF4860 domain-containing protein [Clostridiales bacterium]|jgi:hypothetical protein|nr:DUF4860 domain-containing protein [Clostridiales bacterium]